MKIVVIGSNSFLARNFVYYLRKNGFDDLLLFDYQDSSLDDYDFYRKICITDKESLCNIDFDCDLIYYFVGKTGTEKSISEYSSFIDINEKALLNVLTEMADKQSKAKIIFPSSRLVYKGKETALKETDELEAKTIYASTKICDELYLKMFHNIFGIKYCVLRICVPYGTLIENASSYGTADFFINKGKKGEPISIFGDGRQKRTFTHIFDLCEVMLLAGVSKECANDCFNVGGEVMSLKELAEFASTKYNVSLTYSDWPTLTEAIESGSTFFDSSKLDLAIKKTRYISFREWINNK